LLNFFLTAKGQLKVNPKDSIAIKKQIEGFYSWYAGLIRDGELNQKFNPTFVRLKNGMTTLDFSNYKVGLRKHKFTKNFIERKVSEYKPCVDNLRTVQFDSLNKFELDELENIKCDFSNTYEWGAGMDPIDGAEVVGFNKLGNDKIEAIIRFRSIDGEKDFIVGTNTFTLIRVKTDWKVDDYK
jgi:hypothetical protein